MSADRLREAARLMREQHGPQHERHKMWAAMAEWLTVHAEFHNDVPMICDWTDLFVAGGECAAEAVANAYLGDTP